MWSYSQRTGRFRDAAGHIVGIGYAGRNVPGGAQGKNNPALERFHDVGPLPHGRYEIGQVEDHPKLGPMCIPLVQVSGESFGRLGFFIHGDSGEHPGDASCGCIVLPRDVRSLIAGGADKELLVHE